MSEIAPALAYGCGMGALVVCVIVPACPVFCVCTYMRVHVRAAYIVMYVCTYGWVKVWAVTEVYPLGPLCHVVPSPRRVFLKTKPFRPY